MPTIPYDTASHVLYLTANDGTTFAGEGEPDGEFFNATYDNSAVSAIEGAKGTVQFSQRIASLGTITSTTQWGADYNKILTKMFNDQQKGLHPQGISLKRINDNENVTVINGLKFMIEKLADYAIGTEGTDRGWSLKVEQMKFEEVQDPA